MLKRTRFERDCRRRSSENTDDDDRIVVEFQPEGSVTRMSSSAFERLTHRHDGGPVLPSNMLDRSFGAATFFSGCTDAADPTVVQSFQVRPAQELRTLLATVAKTSPRCSKHGPFGCTCITMQLLGVLLRNLAEAFLENICDDNIVILQDISALPSGVPVIAVLVDTTSRSLHVQCYGPGVFPFHKAHLLCDSIHKLARWDRLEDVEPLIREGWSSHNTNFWKHKGFHLPTCSNCNTVTSVSASCAFCPKLFCKQCTTICPSCDFYQTCYVCLVNGLVFDRVSVRHCCHCAEQPSAKDGYIVTADGRLVMLKHPIEVFTT
ncbi:unnamed protein product [Bodo saltans]|uniref:Uncharacterized protein n=1 Tax=Bodo saltans TaxID=75058 RepID=A0A0S4IUR6_BODSA|nr:unnamed protein product [Bodo saltans]|eukprot:CUF99884.1 unnamed protein product [Bodo saltans]